MPRPLPRPGGAGPRVLLRDPRRGPLPPWAGSALPPGAPWASLSEDTGFATADGWDEQEVQAALVASLSDGWDDQDVGLSCSSPSSSSWEPLRTTEEQARSEAHE